MADGRVTGEQFTGLWADVGTPERLAQLDAQLRAASERRDREA
jgi:MurNAc alpha-1-phosphate uridylyltransferase